MVQGEEWRWIIAVVGYTTSKESTSDHLDPVVELRISDGRVLFIKGIHQYLIKTKRISIKLIIIIIIPIAIYLNIELIHVVEEVPNAVL